MGWGLYNPPKWEPTALFTVPSAFVIGLGSAPPSLTDHGFGVRLACCGDGAAIPEDGHCGLYLRYRPNDQSSLRFIITLHTIRPKKNRDKFQSCTANQIGSYGVFVQSAQGIQLVVII
jgi:hypothetical protein